MSDDLISKSVLIEEMRKFTGNQRYLISEEVWRMVENSPIVFNTSNVLEQIGKRMFSAECYNEDFDGTQIDNLLCYGDVAEIICDGGVGENTN